jgi:hypothetical protein
LTPREEGIPNISITGFTGMSVGQTRFSIKQVYEVTDNLSVNQGAHNFKFGGLYRYNMVDSSGGNLQRGQLSFTRDIAGITDGFAAFLLGIPTSSNSAEGSPLQYARQNKFAFYWLDDWKATSKLTINFGLRWDIFTSAQENNGRFRNLSFADNEARVINGMFVPMLVPDPNVKKKLYDINLKQLMPRLGVAYRMTDTMVLRFGAGQFYNAQQLNNFTILQLQPPFSGSTVFQNDRTQPLATIQNPFAGSAVTGPAALVMLGNIQADRGNRPLYLNNDVWQWSAEIQKSFGRDLVTSVAYVGSKGSNIDLNLSNFNNPDPGLGNIQTRRPYPFYVDSREPNRLLQLGTIRYLDTSVSSNYNALQLRAEKRYSHGLTFVGSFNYQKAFFIGYGINEGAGFGPRTTQDPRNRLADYGRSNLDQRFRYVFSHIWEIPVMRGARGLKGGVLGGWSVNGIIQLTSGLPVTISQSGDSHNNGGGAPRPHIVAGAKVTRVMEGRNLDRWFNTDAVIRSKCDGCAGEGIFLGPKGYGNAGTALFDAPAQKTWDFALFKDFRVKESHRVQFRWEVFNFLNTPQFSAPSSSLGGATFGRINSTLANNREMQFALKYIF